MPDLEAKDLEAILTKRAKKEVMGELQEFDASLTTLLTGLMGKPTDARSAAGKQVLVAVMEQDPEMRELIMRDKLKSRVEVIKEKLPEELQSFKEMVKDMAGVKPKSTPDQV